MCIRDRLQTLPTNLDLRQLGRRLFIDKAGHRLFLDLLLAALGLPQKALASLVLGWRCDAEGVVLVVDDECFVPESHSSLSDLVAVAVDRLEGLEVKLPLLENVVIAHLVSRLLRVELVLKDRDLVVQRLQLVEESALLRCFFSFDRPLG